MTDRTREALEKALLADPFASDNRRAYAEILFAEEAWTESRDQWRLLVRQDPEDPEPHLRAAECSRALADEDGVREHVEAARACKGFEADDPRVEAFGLGRPPAAMRLVDGGRAEPAAARILSIDESDVVRFADVVGMESVKKVLRLRIVEPFLNPGLFRRFRKRSGGGVLLYGPPGCGKTLMARAIATECDALFTAVGISDILNMWIGESERNLSAIFERARAESPAVLFFDELDALAYARSKAHSDHTRTLVNEFLGQLDGLAGRNDKVLVLAATNMPWDVDEAMKRPGRFDRQIFVPPPDAAARAEMFVRKLRGVPCDAIDFAALGAVCHHYSGADIDGVIELAKDAVLAEILDGGAERPLSQADLAAAIDETTPSTTEWLKTARNLVKFGGAGSAYGDVEKYLRASKLY